MNRRRSEVPPGAEASGGTGATYPGLTSWDPGRLRKRLGSLLMRGRRAGWALLAFFALLPLQWHQLAVTPVGIIRWFHVGAVLLVVLAPPHGWRRVIRFASPMFGALALMSFLLTVTGLVYGTAWANPAQHWLYGIIGLTVACALIAALEDPRGRRLVAWCGPVAVTSFLLVFGQSLTAVGGSPTAALSASLGGNPSVALMNVFRVVFRDVDPNLAVAVRHEIFACLLVAAVASWLARPAGVDRLVVSATSIAVTVLLLASLSRAVLLAAAAIPLLMAARFLLRTRLNLSATVAILAGLMASPWVLPAAWRILESRIVDDTGSYDARLGTFNALDAGDVAFRMFLGGGEFGLSTHMMIADAALLGGLMAGAAATVLVGSFAVLGWRAAAAYLQSRPGESVAAAGCVALVLVRCFTVGGGLLHMVEWTAVGVALAAALLRSDALCHQPRQEAHACRGGVGGVLRPL